MIAQQHYLSFFGSFILLFCVRKLGSNKLTILAMHHLRLALLTCGAAFVPLVASSGVECPTTVPWESACPAGCYAAPGGGGNKKIDDSIMRPCQAVGPGYYSPHHDNDRYECSMGSYSNFEMAHACIPCPAGTYGLSDGETSCSVCPAGTYSNMPRSIFCSPCDDEYYSKDGANSIQVWNGRVFCYLTLDPNDVPIENDDDDGVENTTSESASFVVNDTAVTTLAQSISVSDTQFDDSDQDWIHRTLNCPVDNEYMWHGQCMECPSTIRMILHPSWIGFLLVAIIAILSYLADPTVLWIGLEFFQMTFFLGLFMMKEQPHSILVHVERWILSIVVMDLEAGFSWQCLLSDNLTDDLVDAVDQLGSILLPLIVSTILCLLASKPIQSIRAGQWLTIGFFLGHFKFVVTALEALHCASGESPEYDEWFCRDSILSYIVGVIGMIIYGVAGPTWLAWQRYSQVQDSESPIIDCLGFIKCWWWPMVWILRRTLLAALPLLFPERPSWILTMFLVILMCGELLQRFASPVEESGNDVSIRWLRASTVDAVLQSLLIGLAGLHFLSLAMPPETMRADGLTIAVFYLILLVSAFLYWITALFHELLQVFRQQSYLEEVGSHADDDDEKSRASTSTASSHNRSPKALSNATKSLPHGGLERPAPPSIPNDNDMLIHHSLSLVATPGPGDDLDIESVMEESVSMNDNPVAAVPWRAYQTEKDHNVHDYHPFRSRPRPACNETYEGHQQHPFVSSLPPGDSSSPRITSFDNDDTSTLTDNNSYVPAQPYYHRPSHYRQARRSRRQEKSYLDTHSVMESATVLESSEDGTPMIFNDEEEDDNVQEVWIDQDTGLPVDKDSGEWADALTGQPLESCSSSSSRSSSSSKRHK